MSASLSKTAVGTRRRLIPTDPEAYFGGLPTGAEPESIRTGDCTCGTPLSTWLLTVERHGFSPLVTVQPVAYDHTACIFVIDDTIGPIGVRIVLEASTEGIQAASEALSGTHAAMLLARMHLLSEQEARDVYQSLGTVAWVAAACTVKPVRSTPVADAFELDER